MHRATVSFTAAIMLFSSLILNVRLQSHQKGAQNEPKMTCHGSGGYPSAFHCGGPYTALGYSMTPCEIFGKPNDNGTGVQNNASVPPVSVSPPEPHIISSLITDGV